jgi:predicted neuraminidase
MATESYLCPPHVITPPTDAYADQSRQFQGIPGIERASNGRFWATWYGGGIGEDGHNYVVLATSTNAHTWSNTSLIIDHPDNGLVRSYDPCLWHDPQGKLWLFWAQGYEKHTDERSGVWAITTENSDSENPTWSTPTRICDGIMMNKPIVLKSGQWVLPVAQWFKEGSSGVVSTSDQGKTWSLTGQANVPIKDDRSCDEHMIIERTDGSLWMLIRTSYGIGESVSTDQGKTWSPVAPSPLQHTVSRFFIRRLHSGNLLLVKHGATTEKTKRSHLTAILSQDDGKTWEGGLLLDERLGVSYPDAVQSPDGTISLTYDYDRRGDKKILLAQFTEDDILQGACVSDQAKLQILINQAFGEIAKKE